MENGEYQRLRRNNLRWSLLLLLLGSAAGSVVMGIAHSSLPQWLPFQSWAYTVVEWTTRFLSAVLESFQQVLMMQVLVWWVWKPANQNRCPIGAALTAAVAVGAALQLYAMTLGVWLANQSVDAFFDLNTHAQYLISSLWMLCMLAILWVALSAARPIFATRLVDVSANHDRQDLIPGRTWSIRGLMIVTLVTALVIVAFQQMFRYQQESFGEPFPNAGLVSLIIAVTYCSVCLIVLWRSGIGLAGRRWSDTPLW